MLRIIHRKRIAAIALFAVLFSAMSPTFAAFKYRGHPEVLAQICTTHELERVALDDRVPAGGPHHIAHQIHCAWCSASAAQPGIGGTSVPNVAIESFTQHPLAVATTASVPSAPAASYYSQAPPVPA